MLLSALFAGACGGGEQAATRNTPGASDTAGGGQSPLASGAAPTGNTDPTPASSGAAAIGGMSPATISSGGSTAGAPSAGAAVAGGGAEPSSGGAPDTGSAAGGTPASGGGAGTPPQTGGSGPSSTDPSSTGCGQSSWPEGDQTYTLDVDGTQREFIVALPDGYDPNTPYRLAFGFHGRTGTASQIAGGFGGGFYGLQSRIGDSTILVAPQGLGTAEDPADTGWPNTGGRDIAFVEAMLTWLDENYCVDSSRIFATGMSYGGIMSNTIACQLGSVFRGVAPIAGAIFGGGSSCLDEPLAVWMTHGTADMDVEISGAEAALELYLAHNHCDTNAEPVAVEPDPCVAYQGCDSGYPVHWCVHDGGHIIPDFSQQAIADFFEQF